MSNWLFKHDLNAVYIKSNNITIWICLSQITTKILGVYDKKWSHVGFI